MKPLWIGVAVLLALYVALRWRRLSTERKLLLGVVAAGAAVYGSGAVHPPNLEKLIEDIGSALGKWTYLLVGALAFLETGAFVGLVAPGETTIILGGVVAGQGEIDVLVLIGIVWICAVAGDVTSYFLGRRLGRGFLEKHGPKVQITPERLEQVERFFDQHGGKAIFIGRFVGLVRAVAPFIAGSSRMPLSRFLPMDILGAGLWGTTFVVLGYVFWQSFGTVVDYAKKGAFALGTTIAVVVGAVWAYRFFRVPENRARAKTWVDEQAERPALRPVARAARPVYRRVLRPIGRRVSGPVRFVWGRLTPGQLGLELTTLLAVTGVAAYVFTTFAFLVDDGRSFFTDRRAFDLLDPLGDSALVVDALKVVTALGSSPFVGLLILLAMGALGSRRRWPEALALLAGGLFTLLGVHQAKAALDRPRPEAPLSDTLGSAFPSGHAAYSIGLVAIAVALTHAMPALRRGLIVGIAIGVAAAVGLSRVALRAHYLSDVIGGWALGAAIFGACGVVALIVGFFRQNGGRP